jgi:peptidoglycan hydrolase-like protein with peptidoglycan-binding domain
MQPYEVQKAQAAIDAARANAAQSATARDVALEGLRQSKVTFGREETLNKEADALRADMMKLSTDPTSATREKLLDLSYRAAAFAPKSYEPLQKMLKDYPRTGKMLENAASDVIFSVQSGQPNVAAGSVNRTIKAAQTTLEANPNDKDAQAALALLEPVQTLMKEEKYGEAMITASNFLRNTYPERWDAVTKDMKESGAGAKAMAEVAGEKTKSELQEAQARLARADARLKELKATGKLDPEEAMKQENTMRSEFLGSPFLRTFPVRNQAYNEILIAERTPIGDGSKIVSFIKLQDPGSVVSVTEKGQITSTTPMASLQALINKFTNDGILDDKTRNDIDKQSKNIFETAKASYQKEKNNTIAIAKRYGLNPDNIIPAYDTETEKQPAPPTPDSGQSAEEARIRAMLRPAAGFGNTMTPSQIQPQGSTFQGRPADVDAILKQLGVQ